MVITTLGATGPDESGPRLKGGMKGVKLILADGLSAVDGVLVLPPETCYITNAPVSVELALKAEGQYGARIPGQEEAVP